MKRLFTISVFSLFVMLLSAQEKKELMYISLSTGEVVTYDVNEVKSIHFEVSTLEEETPAFPKNDGSAKLDIYNPQKTAASLLKSAGVACTNTMGRIVITTDEYNEIKQFTDELVKGYTKQKDIHDVCFSWIYKNVKHGSTYDDDSSVNNDPYQAFTTKKAVCQGFANLLFVMMHSQSVPVLLTNGLVYIDYLLGGHAWNYVNCDGVWYVSDPTNNGIYEMEKTSSYSFLQPQSFDVILFEEQGCKFDFNEKHLNLCSVTTTSRSFVVPFSAGGYQVTSFNPTSDLPANIRELYIGKNIETFGENLVGLDLHGSKIERIHVDPEHEKLYSYEGVVYRKNSFYPEYIPAAMKKLVLQSMDVIEKNLVYGNNGIEEVIVAKGTKSIESWAFENCPNLKVAYVPEGVEIAEEAFCGVHGSFKVIRTE